MNEKRVMVCGGKIRYIESGEGQPLLLLPSASGRATEYRGIIPLLEHHFHVYAIDYPGFGQSDPLQWIEGSHDLATFVEEWMRSIDLDRCHVAGFSLGGWVGLSLALSKPERISKLILVAASGGRLPGIPIINPSGMNYQEILNLFYCRPEIRKKLAQQKLTKTEREEVFRSSRALAYLAEKQKVVPEFHDRLHEIQVPTLIIGADQDRAVPLPYQRRLHAGITQSKLVILKETGHAIVDERPVELAQEIQNFLK